MHEISDCLLGRLIQVVPILGCLVIVGGAFLGTQVAKSAQPAPPNFIRVSNTVIPSGSAHMLQLAEGKYGLVIAGKKGAIVYINGHTVKVLTTENIGSAIKAPDGNIWYTKGQKLQLLNPEKPGETKNSSVQFLRSATQTVGDNIYLDRLGNFWGDKLPQRVTPQGTALPAISVKGMAGISLAPEIADQHGNLWTLLQNETLTRIALLTPTATAWDIFTDQQGVPAKHWNWLVADEVGFIWAAGPGGIIRFDPRKPGDGWRQIAQTADFPAGNVTAMCLSARGRALVAVQNKGIYQLDCLKNGTLVTERVDTSGLPAKPINGLFVDTSGRTWVVCDKGLYRCEAASDAWQRTWEACASLPYSAHDIYGAVVGQKIYIPGGAAFHGCPAVLTNFDQMLVYDTPADRWDAITMPHTRCYCGVAVLNGEIWVVGGYTNIPTGGQQMLTEVDIYNLRDKTWHAGPPLPVGRREAIIATVNNRVYVIGGVNIETALASVISIGPGEDTWRNETANPTTIRQCDGCVLGDTVYIMMVKEGLLAYNTSTQTWQRNLAEIPTKQPPSAAAVVAMNDEVWVLGGFNDNDITHTSAWRYRPSTNSWLIGPAIPHGSNWYDGAAVNGQLYIFGGAYYSKPHENFIFNDTIYRLRSK